MNVLQNATAIARGGTRVPFQGNGGVPPYSYAVLPGGAGGTIDPLTGVYTSPNQSGLDTIEVTDSTAQTAQATIMVGTAMELFCDVLQKELGLANGRVYLWDQKIMEPKDSGLYIAVGVTSCKPFGNSNRNDGSGAGLSSFQYANFQATLSLDIISRGPEARDRKEEVILALRSQYAQSQMELNSFHIARLSTGFTNLSTEDGAAIPYRFNISVNMMYAVKKESDVSYYDEFPDVSVVTDP